MNPLLYVLGYGAPFVAQGTPADMPGLAAMIEEAIRFPGFAFVNVQSPCVTFGEEDQQLKAHKATHEAARKTSATTPTDRLQAMDAGAGLRDGAATPASSTATRTRRRRYESAGARAAAARSRPARAAARRASSTCSCSAEQERRDEHDAQASTSPACRCTTRSIWRS